MNSGLQQPARFGLARPTTLAIVYVLLVIASSVSFRQRDPMATLNNAIDAQVAFELGVWCVVAAWLGLRTLRDGRRSPLNHPWASGPVLLAYLPYLILVVLSTIYATVPMLSRVRAFQSVVLFALTAWTFATLSANAGAYERFWLVHRRMWWTLALVATALTFILPFWTPFLTNFQGAGRFRWFAGQPVGTAGMLGVSLVMLSGSVLGHPDPLFRGRARIIARNVLLVALVAALLATKARGALGATTVAVGVLAMLSPDRRKRGWVGLGCLTVMTFLLSGVLDDLVREVVLREQDLTQILTLTGRTHLASEALPLILERPVFGHGYLSARAAFLELTWGAGEAHNMILEVLFSTGVVGLAVFLAFLSRFVMMQREALRTTIAHAGMVREACALLVFLLIAGVVDDGFVGAPGSHTVALMMAILCTDVALGSVARRRRAVRYSDVAASRGPLPSADAAVTGTTFAP